MALGREGALHGSKLKRPLLVCLDANSEEGDFTHRTVQSVVRGGSSSQDSWVPILGKVPRFSGPQCFHLRNGVTLKVVVRILWVSPGTAL